MVSSACKQLGTRVPRNPEFVNRTKTIWRWAFEAALGFGVALFTLGVIGIVSYKETRNLIAAEARVNHTHEELEETQAALVAVGESERDEHALADTGDPAVLKTPVLETIEQHLERLTALSAGDQRQGQLAELQELLHDKNQRWREALQANTQDAGEVVPLAVALNVDSRRMREVLGQLAREETQLLRTRTETSESGAVRVVRIILVLVVFTFIFLGMTFRAIVKDIRRRSQQEAALQELQEQLRKALEKEKELARLDTLTGLANRRAFYEALEKERARTHRYGRPLTVAYLDVDDFKRINDSQGHAVGDMVLVTMAQTLRENLRVNDVVARLGGDEFAILLPETDVAAAEVVVRKIQDLLGKEMAAYGWPITFSIGVANFLDPPESLEMMIRTADELMYMAKAAGKNHLSLAVMG
jgi:diguanylate cyclase (GGDEF)-like protein